MGSAARIARLRSRSSARLWAIRNSQARSGGALLQLVQGDEGAGEGVLHHILAVDHRAHQARAVAVKLRPQLAGERQELRRGAPWAARMGLRSSRLSLEDRDPRIALQAEGEARGVLRIVQHRDQVVTELAGRHRRAEPGQERLGLDAHRPRVGAGRLRRRPRSRR